MNTLTIFSTPISLHNSLYSLNDLHRAAGGNQNHKPVIFLRNKQTQDLIAEIDKGENSHLSHEVTRGATGGTYVCKELVYAYAMWISPKFNLAVIRAFDAQHTMPAPQADSRVVLHMRNGQVIRSQALSPDHHILTLNDFEQLLKRAGMLVINRDDAVKTLMRAIGEVTGVDMVRLPSPQNPAENAIMMIKSLAG